MSDEVPEEDIVAILRSNSKDEQIKKIVAYVMKMLNSLVGKTISELEPEINELRIRSQKGWKQYSSLRNLVLEYELKPTKNKEASAKFFQDCKKLFQEEEENGFRPQNRRET